MNILFLGGTGNISTECAALLHTQGHAISVLSRGRTVVPQEFRAVRADRQDRASVRAALADLNPEVIINFIGYTPEDVATDFEVFAGRVRQYVFISSATVYEKPPVHLPIREDHPLGNAWWDYARKKIACEERLAAFRRESGFPVTVVRPSHTYSRRWVPNLVSSSSYTVAARLESGRPVFVPGDGESPWTLTAASDFAAGLAGLVGNPRAIGESFHITSDEALPWNEIYRQIAEALGASAPEIVPIPVDFICEAAPHLEGSIKGDKAHPGVFDNSKVKRFVPGFECRKPFRTGIRESVDWLRAHPEQKILNPEVDATIDRIIEKWRAR